MIPFDPKDPFPHLNPEPALRDAQRHSEQVDDWLGLQTAAIESELERQNPRSASNSDREYWIGLPVQSLLTPYTEIRGILERLSPHPGQRVIDLGAGYGRMAFVLGRHFPGVEWIGYEVVQERVDEGLRCLAPLGYRGIDLRVADLSRPEFSPEVADTYFLYDFGSRDAVEKTLQDLRFIASYATITVVGRGRRSRDLIERHHPWLSAVVTPQHFQNYSIYRSDSR